MTNYDMRIARAWVDDAGDWWLWVAGTNTKKRKVWNNRDITHNNFPGNSLGHRLIEMGWMPDRRAAYGPITTPLKEFAGWLPSGKDAWVIPCYREQE